MQKAGGTAAFIDAEHAMDPVYAKKLGVKKGPHDLLNDLDVFCSNMLHLLEDLIILVTQDKLSTHSVVALYKVPETKINKECPIRYDITAKSNISVS